MSAGERRTLTAQCATSKVRHALRAFAVPQQRAGDVAVPRRAVGEGRALASHQWKSFPLRVSRRFVMDGCRCRPTCLYLQAPSRDCRVTHVQYQRPTHRMNLHWGSKDR